MSLMCCSKGIFGKFGNISLSLTRQDQSLEGFHRAGIYLGEGAFHVI